MDYLNPTLSFWTKIGSTYKLTYGVGFQLGQRYNKRKLNKSIRDSEGGNRNKQGDNNDSEGGNRNKQILFVYLKAMGDNRRQGMGIRALDSHIFTDGKRYT